METLLQQTMAELCHLPKRIALASNGQTGANRSQGAVWSGGQGFPGFHSPTFFTYNRVANRDRQGQRATDGTMACHYCRKAGHGWRQCRQRARDYNLPIPGRQTTAQSGANSGGRFMQNFNPNGGFNRRNVPTSNNAIGSGQNYGQVPYRAPYQNGNGNNGHNRNGASARHREAQQPV